MNMIYLGIAIISELMNKITTTADIYLKKMWKTYYGDTRESENIKVKDFDWWLIFDKITRTFIINEENRQFFKK